MTGYEKDGSFKFPQLKLKDFPKGDPDKPLTAKQKKLLELIVYEHYPHWKAYDIAYPARDKTKERPKNYLFRSCARVLCIPSVKKKKAEMEQENKERLIEKNLWSKEQSIEQLKYIIKSNREENDRVNNTYNEQVDLILTKLEEAETANDKEQLLNEILELKKKRRNSTINNNAILSAVTELNKMHGFNTQELIVKNKEEFEIDKELAKLSVDEMLEQLQLGINARQEETTE